MANTRLERSLVRTLVGFALGIALLGCALAPVPKDADGNSALPAVAFEQVSLYRLEVTLLIFYGGLLLITPAVSGLVQGRLPTEISARGAKFVEEADQSNAGIRGMEEIIRDLTERLVTANFEVDRLREASMSDSKQPAVDSKR